MAAKTIFVYQNGTSGGGSKRSLLSFVKTLYGSSDFQVRIIATNRGWFTSKLDELCFPYEYISGFENLLTINRRSIKSQPLLALFTIISAIFKLPVLWRRFAALKPECMLINEGPRELLEFLPFLFRRKAKLILISQIETELDDPISRFMCSRVDAIFAASNAVAAHFEGRVKCPVYTTPLIVEVPEDTSMVTPDIRKELNLHQDAQLIINISAIHPRKGILDLVEAFSQITKQLPNAHLIHVGAVNSKDNAALDHRNLVLKRVDDLKLNSKVHFLGQREDLLGWLSQTDLAIFTTTREGLCRAAVESLWAGVPIISYDIPSMKEVIKNNETGYLVPQWDNKAIADRAITLLSDSRLLRQFSDSSKAFWQETFSSSHTAPIWLKAVHGILQNHRTTNQVVEIVG